jgi:hypothetical protein
MRYLLGTGYHPNSKTPIPAEEFARVWLNNLSIKKDYYPSACVVIGHNVPMLYFNRGFTPVPLKGDLGHIRDKHEGRKNHHLVGWTGTMLALALLAYNSELDLIYKEQDALGFGHVEEHLYKDVGDGGMTIGPPLASPHQKLTSAQSLFLVKHFYIPTFVQHYLSCGEDACYAGQFGEQKFTRLFNMDPRMVRVSGNWILDRNRPMTWDAPVWSAQQWTLEEFNEAKRRNLI